MRTALIAGATGLVGSHVLQRLLADPAFDRVVAVGRRLAPLEHPKLTQQVVSFSHRTALEQVLPPVDDVFCCLGTTRKAAGSAEAFYAVDFTACLHLAEAAKAKGARRFLLISSLGASPRSLAFYARVKGQVEQAVSQLGYEQVELLRPSILDGPREEKRPGERVGLAAMRGLASVLGRQSRYAPIQADAVAAAMVRLALRGEPGVHVRLSEELHHVAAG